LVKVPELPPFVVAKPKYTDFPDILFKSKVTKTSSADYVFFLMKDREVVNRAVREGATLATELDEEIPSFRNN
jgi:hypothetical protein